MSRAAALRAGLALLLFAPAGCDGCGGGAPPLARLALARGAVERDHAAAVGTWSASPVGDAFQIGDGVRTKVGATARVELTAGGGLDLGSDTLVRFLDTPPGEATRVRVDTGEAQVDATSEVVFDTQFGLARVERGGRVRVTGGARAGFSVEIGRASIERADGTAVTATAGQRLVVSLGGAILEPFDATPATPPSGASPPSLPPPSEPPPSAVTPGSVAASVEGDGVTVRRGEQWDALPAGPQQLASGQEVRVQAGSAIEVRRGAARARLAGEGQAVVDAPGGALLSARSGNARITTGAEELRIEVPGGAIVVRPESEAELQIGASETDVTARRGGAELVGEQGETRSVEAGERDTLAVVAAPEDDEGEESSAPVGATQRPHVVIPAGESAAIHAATLPVRVRLELAGCAGETSVELGRGVRARGDGGVVVSLGRGRHGYRVRCGEGTREGTLRVLRDAGGASLPRAAPRTTVDADGRRYTVLYQNLLPQLTLRWRGAPAGASTLRLRDGRGAERVVRDARTEHQFRSGEVDEGTYRFVFEAGGQRSPETTLVVDFDNAAPTASLREPADGAPTPGTVVVVSGTAIDGARVSVAGVAIPVDRAFRFRGDVSVPTDTDALAVRVAHPDTGIHYYLRRVSGASR